MAIVQPKIDELLKMIAEVKALIQDDINADAMKKFS